MELRPRTMQSIRARYSSKPVPGTNKRWLTALWSANADDNPGAPRVDSELRRLHNAGMALALASPMLSR